jgi:hypothetical protein
VADAAQLSQKHPGPVSRWPETPHTAADQSELIPGILTLIARFDSTNRMV